MGPRFPGIHIYQTAWAALVGVPRTATKLATALAWSAATSACSAEATGLADELDLDVWRVKTMRFEDPTSMYCFFLLCL